ncbi:hypothetical protein [Candidatus Mesenet endosymbiont of Agriotes lineatus]|uniref:hypothetical protein n=1 Tax=Candidatus Mesenet endosymbiont of Agriotes lineatus TaxID=3077948 RepID=UPI0030CE4A3A
MDFTNLTPGCYEVDGYIVSHNIDDSHYYPHNYDNITIDENYEIYSEQYQSLTGSVMQDINDNLYLHFEDKEKKDFSYQVNLYYEKSFDDGVLLFSTQDNDLLCLKIKKSEC